MMLSYMHENLLCEGYGRENCIYSIPLAIIHVCFKYLTKKLYWTINKEKVKQLLNDRNNERIYDEPFRIKNITFQCYLKRNGDSILLYITHKFKTEQIKYIHFCFELFCHETQSHWKGVNIYETSKRCWSRNTMKLYECKNKKTLTFYYEIDVLCITYSSILNKVDFYKVIKMNKEIKFNWNINKKELKIYKNYAYDRYVWYPNNFKLNNIFCGWLAPNGKTKKISNMLYGVDLINAFPAEIEKMKIKISVQDITNNFIFEGIELFKRKGNNLNRTKTLKMIMGNNKNYEINKLESIALCWTIEVLSIYGRYHHEIPKQQWNQYNII